MSGSIQPLHTLVFWFQLSQEQAITQTTIMSEFWHRKMKTYFKRIDFDHDGAITRSDFQGMGDRFVNSGKVDAATGEHLKKTLTDIWDLYLKVAGHAEKLDEKAFVKTMKDLVKDKKNKKTLEGPLPLFFNAVDANQDGFIQQDEFEMFFDLLGLDQKMAGESFRAIDTNNDGLLSKEEFMDAGVDFFVTDDEAHPTKLFWGPLL